MTVSRLITSAIFGVILGYVLSQVFYAAIAAGIGENKVAYVEHWFPVGGAVVGLIAYPLIIIRTLGDGFIPILGWLIAVASLLGILTYIIFDLQFAFLLLFGWVIVTFLGRIFYFIVLRKRRDTKI